MTVNCYIWSLQPVAHSITGLCLRISRISYHVPSRYSFPRFFNPRIRTFATVPSIEMKTVNTSERLKALRQIMKDNKVDIYGKVVHLTIET